MKSKHQKRVELFHKAAGQTDMPYPSLPPKEILLLRAKLIFEEAMETIEALGCHLVTIGARDDGVILQNCDIEIETGIFEPDLEKIADGCGDLSVVNSGTMLACGIDDTELLEEIDANNLAKFGPGGYRRDDGKWVKPPDHQPPDIKGILDRQREEKMLERKQKADENRDRILGNKNNV